MPTTNSVEIPKEPEFVIFASYSHPSDTPMRHSVLKEMVRGIIIIALIPLLMCKNVDNFTAHHKGYILETLLFTIVVCLVT